MSNPLKHRKYARKIIKGIRKFFYNTACEVLVTRSLGIVNLRKLSVLALFFSQWFINYIRAGSNQRKEFCYWRSRSVCSGHRSSTSGICFNFVVLELQAVILRHFKAPTIERGRARFQQHHRGVSAIRIHGIHILICGRGPQSVRDCE